MRALSFSACYRKFCKAGWTLPATPGVREAWHQGRRWYAVWVLKLEDVAIQQRRIELYQLLSKYLLPSAPHQPHITVWVHGFSPAPTHPLEEQSFAVEIGPINSFTTCPFLEVRAKAILNIRADFSTPEERWSRYYPHLTIGRYGGRFSTTVLQRILQPYRSLPALTTTGILKKAWVDAFDEEGRLVYMLPEG
jgi:hypothetical protein